MNKTKIERLFAKLESAIDAHPRIMRVQIDGKPITDSTHPGLIAAPTLSFSRDSFTVKIGAKLRGSRMKRLFEISGEGDTAEEAVDDLIDGLDIWATALE